jgi:glycosyltransferase involved in cell wall biosynthesis
MYQVIKSLALAGHELTLAMLNTYKHFQDPSVLSPYAASIYTIKINTTPSYAKALKNLFWGKFPYNIERFFHPQFENLLTQLLNQKQFDIIQLEGVYLSVYAPLLKKLTKTPLVLRAHNVEFEIWKRLAQSVHFLPKKLYFYYLAQKGKKFEKNSLSFFNGIIPITNKDESTFRSLGYQGPMQVIPACVAPPNRKSPTPPPLPKTCCFLGSLDWLANQQGLLWFLKKVWSKLSSEKGEFHIAGRNPPPNILQLQSPGVFVHGETPDAAAFLEKYAIVVIPLLAGSGMRIKMIEAMSLGKCVIATPIGAEGILGIDGEHFVIAHNAQDFIKKLTYYWNNPNARQKIEKNAIALVENKYNCNHLADRLRQFYQTLL